MLIIVFFEGSFTLIFGAEKHGFLQVLEVFLLFPFNQPILKVLWFFFSLSIFCRRFSARFPNSFPRVFPIVYSQPYGSPGSQVTRPSPTCGAWRSACRQRRSCGRVRSRSAANRWSPAATGKAEVGWRLEELEIYGEGGDLWGCLISDIFDPNKM